MPLCTIRLSEFDTKLTEDSVGTFLAHVRRRGKPIMAKIEVLIIEEHFLMLGEPFHYGDCYIVKADLWSPFYKSSHNSVHSGPIWTKFSVNTQET